MEILSTLNTIFINNMSTLKVYGNYINSNYINRERKKFLRKFLVLLEYDEINFHVPLLYSLPGEIFKIHIKSLKNFNQLILLQIIFLMKNLVCI